MLNVYLGSFFNIEIWPPPLFFGRENNSTRIFIFGILFQHWNMTTPLLGREKDSTRIFIFGIIFQCSNMTPPSYGRDGSFFNVEIWPHLLCTKNVKCIFGIIFQRWNMTPSPLGRENDSTRIFIFGIIFQRWNMPPPPPMAEKVHFSMLRYDPIYCQKKVLGVSFWILRNYPIPVIEKKFHVGSFFNVKY